MDKAEAYEGRPMAFPCDRVQLRDGVHSSIGMELRDYFAAKAMQGMLAGKVPLVKEEDAINKVSRAAYLLADAMLEVRNARP